MSAASVWAGPGNRPVTDLPWTMPIPEEFPRAPICTRDLDDILRLIRDACQRCGSVYMRYERGRKTITGGPQRIADHGEWFIAGAADGVHAAIPHHAARLDRSWIVWSRIATRGLMRNAHMRHAA